MFTTDTDLQVTTHSPTLLHAHGNELSNAACVERLERIKGEDFLGEVIWKEAVHIVTAVTKGHLCQVIGTKTLRRKTRINKKYKNCGSFNRKF